MLGYYQFFPEKVETELRHVTFFHPVADDGIPPGKYHFTEYFCTDPECECQRVLVKVLRDEPDGAPPKDVATISYTWSNEQDSSWSFLTADEPNPFLDPLHPTTDYSADMLNFWREMIQRDKGYAKRIERHYHELRAACTQASESPARGRRTSGKTRVVVQLTKPERRARKRKLAKWNRFEKSR